MLITYSLFTIDSHGIVINRNKREEANAVYLTFVHRSIRLVVLYTHTYIYIRVSKQFILKVFTIHIEKVQTVCLMSMIEHIFRYHLIEFIYFWYWSWNRIHIAVCPKTIDWIAVVIAVEIFQFPQSYKHSDAMYVYFKL